MMFLGIIFGLTVGILILLSGWIRFGLLFVTKGFIGNNLPWLYLIFGFYIGKGISDGFSTFEYWITFISSMLSALVVNQVSAKHEMRSDRKYGTVSTSGSMILVGGLTGMLFRLIF